jgi:transposase
VLVVELVGVNAGLREVIAAKDHQIAAAERRIAVLDERIAELERRLSKDSSTSNKPPSSDSPYRKPASRSSRTSSGRKPGKQPGAPGATMPLVDDPDEVITCDPACCGGCGRDLLGAAVAGVQRRQVSEVRPPPPPWVTEYRLLKRVCPGCGGPTVGAALGFVRGRACYGPSVLARAAELVCGHYLPVGRAAMPMGSLLGVEVSRALWRGCGPVPPDCWRRRFCPGSGSYCAQSGCCTPMRRQVGRRAG